MPSRLTNSTSASCSVILIGTHVATSAMPPLPGAHQTPDTRGDCFIFQASACSRPPLPMTRTFMCARIGSAAGACQSACALLLHVLGEILLVTLHERRFVVRHDVHFPS